MALARVHHALARLCGAVEPESIMEQVEQTRVIRIAGVLRIKLPVAVNMLALVSKNLDRLAHDTFDVLDHDRPQKVTQRLYSLREAGEDQPAHRICAQLFETMLLHVEVARHAALTLKPAPERNPDQIAFQIIGPLMIYAFQSGPVAAYLAADQGTAVGAAVNHDMDFSVAASGNYYRGLTNEGRLEVSRLWNFRFQGNERPGFTLKDALLLSLIIFRIGEYPIRYTVASDIRRF